MVRKIKKIGYFEEFNEFEDDEEILYHEDFDSSVSVEDFEFSNFLDRGFNSMLQAVFEEGLEKERRRQEKLKKLEPLILFDLNIAKDIIDKAKKFPIEKNKKISEHNFQAFPIEHLLSINSLYRFEKKITDSGCFNINDFDLEKPEQFIEFDKAVVKIYLKKYGIGSKRKLEEVVTYLVNHGKREEYRIYAKAASPEETMAVKERTASKKARKRKYDFIQKFKNELKEDVLYAWDLKEALNLLDMGEKAEYITSSFTEYLKFFILNELEKNCQGWKELAISCVVGELMELYQYYGNEELESAEIYGTYITALQLFEDNVWNKGNWIKSKYLIGGIYE